jgi:hypothetical protein
MLRKGVVDLPLHGGKCPRWLFERMVKLGRAILLLICEEFGREEVVRRLTDPFWFQALGCVLGFDWHSSGLTTTVGGAVKEALKPYFKELGLFICGGKGKTALKTPQEIEQWGEKAGLSQNAEKMILLSRLTAKIDNNAIQDGFQIYFHMFIFTTDGKWGVVQQGMDEISAYARRYHWYSDKVVELCEEPHAGIISEIKKENVLNLVAKKSRDVRECILKLVQEDFERILKEVRLMGSLFFKREHRLSYEDLSYKSLKKVWEITYENPPREFKELMLRGGLGAKSLRALALVSELIYDVRASREDPVCYAYAHGGKDGHPYRVNKKVYDHTIMELEEILRRIKIGENERLKLFRRLNTLFKI